ncbi:galactitol-1-phosphate 5-dehydrogenase [Alicyclobacillus fodiniaquatilis]|uniref:Galactitol-1-phosphate 5-dehydrogenase n=1 Tax=Alicyclobacillus fodiniaquatilis TaxID=1661150 RepID=A0ABW4JD82_9BACL
MKTMQAAVLHGKDDLRVETVPMPEIGDHDVLVKVMVTGICGSDLPRVLGDGAHFYPIVLGHEFAGLVDKIGAAVTDVQVGDRVAGAPLVPCRSCADCQKGNYAQCKHYTFIGSRIPGSWAEYVKLPAANIVKLPHKASFAEGALFEPSAVALHALRHIAYEGGQDVAILGGGNIGLLALQWARVLGAKSVTVFDIADARLTTAQKLGADYTLNTTAPDFKAACQTITAGQGFGVVLETAGAVAAMNLAFELAGNQAKVCFVGTASQDVTFDARLFELMNRKEFTLTGSWMSYSAPYPGEEWAMTSHFLTAGKLNLTDIVFQSMPLAEINQAFALYKTPGTVQGKILLRCAAE